MFAFIAIAHKNIGEFSAGKILIAQDLHAKMTGIKIDRPFRILHAKHRVQQPEA
jgi:hypothetical protein